ncbi:hypothetical protein SIXOD_v1c14700 [Spiroplasma ixodetis Y32]|nr:hypothetical protein SIXOD_v1c14700 [Spiroplasma ixodetis Y32]
MIPITINYIEIVYYILNMKAFFKIFFILFKITLIYLYNN